MARIVCQVLQRPDRVTFLWSGGSASFAPYHLRGAQAEEFCRLAAQARERLGNLNDSDLSDVGQQLFRAIFPDDPAAQEVRGWLADTHGKNAVQSLEIFSDQLVVPWNVVCEQGEFWGKRYNLTTGRRTNPLRQVPFLFKPEILLIADPGVIGALPEGEKNRLAEFAQSKSLQIVDSRTGVETAIQAQPPEFVYLICRAHANGFQLGQEVISTAEMGRTLRSGGQKAPPVVLVNVCRGSEEVRLGKPDLLERLEALGISGLIASTQPAPASAANTFGIEFLTQFLFGNLPVGTALREVRAQVGAAGLLYSGFCPAHLRVTWEETAESDLETSPPEPLPDQPYRPLAPFDREDRALFSGRDDDVAEFTARLDRADTRLLILHGPSGVGKSSFLRAGVVPFLEDVAGFRALRDRTPEEAPVAETDYPVLSVRAAHDLAGQLAQALCAFCGQPYSFTTPAGKIVTVDLPGILSGLANPIATAIVVKKNPEGISETPQPPPPPMESENVTPVSLWESMQNDLGLLSAVLSAISEPLPHELVILIEQGEEVFTQATRPVDRRRRRQALSMLTNFASSSTECKVILSIRTEYLGRLLDELPLNSTFLLRELTDDEIAEAIVLPTVTEPIVGSTEMPNDKYGFQFAEGVPQALIRKARESRSQEGVLPQVQASCAELYDLVSARQDKVIGGADLKAPAQGATAMSAYVDGLLNQTFPGKPEQQAVKEMVTRLVRQEAGGMLCRILLPPAELAKTWRARVPLDQAVDQVSSDKLRLLEVNQLLIGGEEGLYVGLSQDSLTPMVAAWGEDSKRRQYTRAKVMDVLWIMIPLLFLVGAITFWLTRQMRAGDAKKTAGEDEVVIAKQELKQIEDSIKRSQQIEENMNAIAFPLYAGNMSLADQSMHSGNTLRLRQILLDYQKNKGLRDLRAFEWYYLWRQGQQQRHDLFGHARLITSVAATADGKMIASGSLDGMVKLWDSATGLPMATYEGHQGPVHSVALSPDGKQVVSAGEDKTVKVWKVAGGKGPKDYVVEKKAAHTFSGHTAAVLAVAYSSDGKTIASGSADKTVILWNATLATQQAILKEHKGAVQAVSFSPDSKTLASAGADKLVVLWNVASADKKHVLEGHAGPVFALAFNSNGSLLTSAGEDRKDNVDVGLVRFWDPAKGESVTSFSDKDGKPIATSNIIHSHGIFALAFTPDGKALVSAGKDNLLRFWDPANGKQLGMLPGHLGWVRSVAVPSKSTLIVTGSYDRTVKVWDGGPKMDVLRGHKDWVCAVAFSPDDRLLASGSRDGSVQIWDAGDGRLLDTLENLGGSVLAVAFSPDKNSPKLAAGIWADKGAVKVWDLILDKDKNYQKVKEAHTLLGHKEGVACVAFEKSGKRLASGSGDTNIIIWDLEKGKPEHTLTGHTGGVRCVAFAETGKLASGSDDATIRFWNPTDGKPIGNPLAGHSGAVNGLVFLPLPPDADVAELLISGGNDQTVRWWSEGKGVGIFRGHANIVSAVAVSPKANFFMSASWDNTIKFWASPNSDERFTLSGPTAPVRALAITRNGLTLAAGSNDNTVRIWRAASEKSQPQEHD